MGGPKPDDRAVVKAFIEETGMGFQSFTGFLNASAVLTRVSVPVIHNQWRHLHYYQ